MAQQTISIGTSLAAANNTTGDPHTIAFGKVNANFTELYSGNLLSINMGFGTSQFLFNSYASKYVELSAGTAAAPITTAGPLVKLSRTENLNASVANGSNPVDNECNATLAAYAVGVSGTGMQTCAILAGAEGEGTKDNVGAMFFGRTQGIGTGIGTGLYAEGRRDTTTGNNLGAEIRSNNMTASAESYTSVGYNNGSLWLTAGGNAKSAAGCALGNAGQTFDVGFGLTANSVASQSFRDDSSSVTSLQINGGHTYGIDMTAGAFSGAPLLAPLTTPASSTATGKQGAIVWDANFIYVCTATNTWKRAALSTF